MTSTVLGFPRIGPGRELKRAVERYWAGEIDADQLAGQAVELRKNTWLGLRDAGLDEIPSGTFSYYDHVLDAAVLFDLVAERFRGPDQPATYFAMARGTAQIAPLEMTKWFDTNYHYVVPEVSQATRPKLAHDGVLREVAEARELGIEPRPVLVGPVTLLMLSKSSDPDWHPLQLVDPLVGAYQELLAKLAEAGVSWVQLDEPVLVGDLDDTLLDTVDRVYRRLGAADARPKIVVASYFGDPGPALRVLAGTPIDGIALDFVHGPANTQLLAELGGLPGKTLFAGLVDGRNIWRADLRAGLATGATLLGLADEVIVSSSCSLLHVPIDLEVEAELDPRLKPWLAFANQKVHEVVTLAKGLDSGVAAVATELATNDAALRGRRDAAWATSVEVRAKLAKLGDQDATRASEYEVRAERQRAYHRLPEFPTTTIGSFPQTVEIRTARAALRAGKIDTAEYDQRMRAEIDRVIDVQQEIGLDVLVHGEPERNDMVQYFAEQLTGYATTAYGWVQSYGTRCVRPPIIYGDVERPTPMTVEWAQYAQKRAGRPVKGMLTGPVTMLKWSFVRDDQPLSDTARQIALALRDEVADLEAAGISVIQVDEPALREAMPLRRERQAAYLDWAVTAFRIATAGVADVTQVHTHMCYSEFNEIVAAIDALDADVTTVEAARSAMRLVDDLGTYRRQIGPGVYDIHTPRVPSVSEIEANLREIIRVVDPARVWVNPDCGLKTRGYAEVVPALSNMVQAAMRIRAGS